MRGCLRPRHSNHAGRLRLGLVLVLLVVCGGLLDAAVDRKTAAFMKQRLKMRKDRAEFAELYAAAKTSAVDGYLGQLATIIKECVAGGAHARAEELLSELKSLNPAYPELPDLASLVTASSAQPLDAEVSAAIDEALAQARDQRNRALVGFTNKLIRNQLYGLAYDNVQEILAADPDRKDVRRFLKQSYDDELGQWLHGFYSSYRKKGLSWDPGLGWIVNRERERYAEGLHYDFQERRWGPLSEWDAVHLDFRNPWVIESLHYELRASCDLTTAVAAINTLEDLYNAWVRNFVSFFGREAGVRLFDQAKMKPLVVHLFADRAMYLDFVKDEFRQPGLLTNSAGFYSPSKSASFFYLDQGWESTMWHEVTHQIFGESSAGRPRRIALIEGLAVYMQDGELVDGAIVNPLAKNRFINHFASEFASGKHSSLLDIWDISRDRFHGTDRLRNYAEAGLAMFFLMTFDDGRYRNDVMDFTREAYHKGQVAYDIAAYCGALPEALEQEFETWVRTACGD